MQPAVAAAEIEQGIEAGVERRLGHAAEQDMMVAALVHRMGFALEYAQRLLQYRRPQLARRPVIGAEAVLVPGGTTYQVSGTVAVTSAASAPAGTTVSEFSRSR